ncbi:protein mono-ADP-ribosyltransferase PARP10 [Acanthochromis polyacanthus]|uniref:protein mono-ADP-ribosyltransferase PARP10 n=1 Tax=Acanthochromis polyacanthus TaxID=80966 RepID=UPI000B9052C0|nr:protein mono-ADP-ribosyltransferase PARP10 [Acanthochromis polyacanthus]
MPVESPEERTVEVLQLPEDVDEELLSLYFENKRRSGGGPLISVEKNGNHAVLVFEEAEAAARVLSKGHHVLHNVELSVRKPATKDRCRLLLRGINPSTITEMIELYVENMMGLNENDYMLYPSPERDLILIHLSQPLSKDFQTLSTNISKKMLDRAKVSLEQIEETDSVLVENLHPDTTPDLLTLYFQSERGGNQKVREVTMLSEGTAKVSFATYESVSPVLDRAHKLEGADLVVKPFFDFLQKNSTSQNSDADSQDITVGTSEDMNDVQMQTSPPVVASSSSHSSCQTNMEPLVALETAKEMADELMEDQNADPLSSHIAITDPVKLALFQRSAFQEDLKKATPNFTIQVKDDGVHIAGHDRLQVQQLKQTILEFFGNITKTHITLEPEVAQFLARKDVKKQLLETLNQTGSPTVYTVTNCKVTVISISQNSADQACSLLKSQVCHFSIPVDIEYECMLYCREWSEFLEALDFCSAKVSERGQNIDALTLKGMENEKQTAILEFLTTPIERETVISMEPGMLKYIQNHCHQLLADMDQVSIFPLEGEDVCGLKIHGHAVACQMAEEVLQGVVSSICTRTITVNAPGVARFLDDEECKSILKEMETKFQVYISTKHVLWQPLSYEDFLVTGWKMMSHHNFPRVSMNGSAQQLKTDSVQTDHDGTADKGLLEEAKRIVSAIDEGMEEGVSASDQVEDMDNVDLYSTEGLTDQASAVTAVSASELNATRPQPSDGTAGLSSNLEEEAQLSLAIQYSMESSHWSQENEEEELKKALELSKKMIQNTRSSSETEKSPQVNQLQHSSMHTAFRKAVQAANTVQIEVFAGYSCDLIRVDIAFGKKVSQRQAEEKVEHRTLRNLSTYHKKCLEVIERKHAVQVQIQGSIVTISGFKIFVYGAMCDMKLLMEKISNSISDHEILKTVQWVQHNPASSDTIPYCAEAIVFIENAFRMKLEKVDILLDNQPHIINFEKMEEYNIASGKSVKISRKMLELDELNEELPEEEYSLLSNMPEATKVDEESDEFQNVVKRFYETIQEYHSKIRIIQVEKLMNRLLYNQYKLKKASVLQRATYPDIERTLYHGTSDTSVKEICIHGFNRSFCGKNATVYGQGVYFAVNSALSVQDQYSPPNADGYKYIFVSKVLTGDFTKGCHSMKTAPLKESSDVPLRYDSVTDNITKPSMFVIFNDTQAFPEYLITCQRIHR